MGAKTQLSGTEDQLYGEFDFEAYRELGWFVTKEAVDGRPDVDAHAGADAEAVAGPEDEPDVEMPAPRTPAEGPVPGSSSP